MTVFSENLNLLLVILTVLFTLSPILTIIDGATYPIVSESMGVQEKLVSTDAIGFTAILIVVIPAADLLLDFVSHFLRVEDTLKKSVKRNAPARLSDIERLLFILGVCIQSSKCLLNSTTDLYTFVLVTNCVNHASALLLLGPIIIFLGRCTVTFTPARTFSIIFSFAVGLFFRSVAHYIRSDPATHTGLQAFGNVILVIGCTLYGYLIILCALGYYMQKLSTPADRQAVLNFLLQRFKRSQKTAEKNAEVMTDCESDLYTNYIPALHIMSSIGIVLATSFEQLHPQLAYLTTFSEITVLVIELRIRKNEIAMGLVALLQSKKSYVRYISHELRTPLNTTFLGLKLLTNELKTSKNPKDLERYDTLCDVNMSCTAAVSILNDLLCYEKLESGRMELHKQDINIANFLRDCVSLFSAESMERGVTVSLDLDPDSMTGIERVFEPCHHSAFPQTEDAVRLEARDLIFADKFKMDQVIRNLISNALKFTPRGGRVTIRAAFVRNWAETYGDNEAPAAVARSSSWAKSIKTYTSTRAAQISGQFRPSKRSSIHATPCFNGAGLMGESVSGKLKLVVTDTGAGISVENQTKLFKEIIQFSPEKLQSGGGSGLGMWITAGILDLHGGNIKVNSEGEGKGSTFTVEIPMIRSQRKSVTNTNPSSKYVKPISPSNVSATVLNVKKCKQSQDSTNIFSAFDDVDHGSECSSIVHGENADMISYFLAPSESLKPFIAESEPVKTVILNSKVGISIEHEEDKDAEIGREVLAVTDCGAEVEPDMIIAERRSLMVLVVDDSYLNRKMLLKCLKADGHSCVEAEDGLQAVAKVSDMMSTSGSEGKEKYDAILMDFMMPNMDGPTATKRIRELGYTGAILGVTGNGLSFDVNHFLSCGANRVLLKPLDIEMFHSVMSDMAARGSSNPMMRCCSANTTQK